MRFALKGRGNCPTDEDLSVGTPVQARFARRGQGSEIRGQPLASSFSPEVFPDTAIHPRTEGGYFLFPSPYSLFPDPCSLLLYNL